MCLIERQNLLNFGHSTRTLCRLVQWHMPNRSSAIQLTDVPESFDHQLLQVELYRRDDQTKTGWSEDRWATADRQVFGKGRLWQHSLSLIAPRDSDRVQQLLAQQILPPGRYLVRIYVDKSGRLEKDWQTELGDRDFVGQVEVDSRWPTGYGNMTSATFPAR